MDNRTPSERFWVKVDRRGDDECWPWTAHISRSGYGGFQLRGQARQAHRVAFEELYGRVADGLVIDHDCHNTDPTCPGGDTCLHRRCVNPRHLRAVSQSVNLGSSRHTVNYASTAATHCPNEHPYDADNTAFDGAARYCRTCRIERQRAGYAKRNEEKRARYAELRSLGLTSLEARSGSKRKLAANGAGNC